MFRSVRSHRRAWSCTQQSLAQCLFCPAPDDVPVAGEDNANVPVQYAVYSRSESHIVGDHEALEREINLQAHECFLIERESYKRQTNKYTGGGGVKTNRRKNKNKTCLK